MSSSGRRPKRQKYARGRAPPNTNAHRSKRTKVADVEEQLQRQRKKHAKNAQEETTPAATLGKYRYDADKKAYFPATDTVQDTKKSPESRPSQHPFTHWARAQLCHGGMEGISSQSICYATDISPSCRRQRDLRSVLATRLTRMGLKIVPNVTHSADDRSQLLGLMPPVVIKSFHEPTTETTLPQDMVCKNRLHPSARTFDIHMSTEPDKLPSMATLVHSGSLIRFAHKPKLWKVTDELEGNDLHESLSLGIRPVADGGESEPHAIRFATAPTAQYFDDFLFGTICNTTGQPDDDDPNVFRLWQGAPGVIDRHEFPLPFHVNDFCFHPSSPKGAIGLAPSYSKKHGAGPIVLDIERGAIYHHTAIRFPESDALCIESINGRFLVGHRNGSVSLTERHVERGYAHGVAKDNSLGSATAINVLNDNLFLTKHSFASCCLWDVRKMQPIMTLYVPPDICSKTRSSCCNGIAVDPTKNTVILPFANLQQQPSLAFWSLAGSGGTFCGSKQLSNAQTTGDGLPYCELAGTITSGWNWNDFSRKEGDTVSAQRNSWGLWFKSSLAVGPTSPNFIGSIHHVSFPGNFESPDDVVVNCDN